HQVQVALRAAGRVGGARRRAAARLAPAALARRVDGIALVQPLLHRLEAQLRLAPAVVQADDRGWGAAGAREGAIDVERDTVERLGRAARNIEVRREARAGRTGVEGAAPRLAE